MTFIVTKSEYQASEDMFKNIFTELKPFFLEANIDEASISLPESFSEIHDVNTKIMTIKKTESTSSEEGFITITIDSKFSIDLIRICSELVISFIDPLVSIYRLLKSFYKQFSEIFRVKAKAFNLKYQYGLIDLDEVSNNKEQ